ncbi:hypothetical protein 3 [Hubei orthoptera virus 5]|uniref:Uncharacterized protein n=1 Tax=Hubei orthoptera virus 5 TaxID=1923013 RepID=A0A1L3KN77_9MONO|nr:hypothetical protein 3 [Hubei orthoptera virus 5]APG78860.1 hypothetical protein 3 [Hubei orthoptera virus 5]
MAGKFVFGLTVSILVSFISGRFVSKHEVAIIADEFTTVTLGVKILMPSDLVKDILTSLPDNAPPATHEGRAKLVKLLSELYDRSLRREMINVNKAVTHDLSEDSYMSNLTLHASCTYFPDSNSSGDCSNISMGSDVRPPPKTDHLELYLPRELRSTRRKRSSDVVSYMNTLLNLRSAPDEYSCSTLIPCIYHLTIGQFTYLYIVPQGDASCPSICEDGVSIGVLVASTTDPSYSWRFGNQILACGTRRRNSLLCSIFPRQHTCTCEVLIQANNNLITPRTIRRGKRGVTSGLRRAFNWLSKVLKWGPKKILHSFKKHPWRTVGGTVGFASGVYTIYELVELKLSPPVPSHEEIVSIVEKMRQTDQALVNVSDSLYVGIGAVHDDLLNFRQDMKDSFHQLGQWSDQVTVIHTLLSLCVSRGQSGLSGLLRGELPQTVISQESLQLFISTLLGKELSSAVAMMPLPIRLVNADFISNMVWVSVRVPKKGTTLLGRVYRLDGETRTVNTPNDICYTTRGDQYYFAPTSPDIKPTPSHRITLESCTKSGGILICPYGSLTDVTKTTEHDICFSRYSSPKRSRRDVNKDIITEVLRKTSTFTEIPLPSDTPPSTFHQFTERYKVAISSLQESNKRLEDAWQELLEKHSSLNLWSRLHLAWTSVFSFLTLLLVVKVGWDILTTRRFRQGLKVTPDHHEAVSLRERGCDTI